MRRIVVACTGFWRRESLTIAIIKTRIGSNVKNNFDYLRLSLPEWMQGWAD